ncbi:uncharacterized protein J3D65DRAFT_310641 [Phyllosticta citribraziliensis]|uniref:Uncharacterized protein n=1 Tax=Phyllosticta citribraziliensis TaxID=989973 RepID=A0ABR1M189_9PEZI
MAAPVPPEVSAGALGIRPSRQNTPLSPEASDAFEAGPPSPRQIHENKDSIRQAGEDEHPTGQPTSPRERCKEALQTDRVDGKRGEHHGRPAPAAPTTPINQTRVDPTTPLPPLAPKPRRKRTLSDLDVDEPSNRNVRRRLWDCRGRLSRAAALTAGSDPEQPPHSWEEGLLVTATAARRHVYRAPSPSPSPSQSLSRYRRRVLMRVKE